MANLQDNISQAIADFDDVEAALEENGIDVPYDTDTKEYGNMVRRLYSKGVADGQAIGFVLEPATETKLGGIKIGENLSTETDGTTTVKTSSGVTADGNLPVKSSDVYKTLDSSRLTNEDIENILKGYV